MLQQLKPLQPSRLSVESIQFNQQNKHTVPEEPTHSFTPVVQSMKGMRNQITIQEQTHNIFEQLLDVLILLE